MRKYLFEIYWDKKLQGTIWGNSERNAIFEWCSTRSLDSQNDDRWDAVIS